ncbi:hypothetical protein SK128_007337 [Halocaridina rubra]|uniref:Condensation domain-containing protein n=1 Tax=Halocaridina rubra TaxID=373956 RepID=A0AAN8ZZI0_HALRR
MHNIRRCLGYISRKRHSLPISSFIRHVSDKSSKKDIQWLWEADRGVKSFHEAFRNGTRMGLLEITLNTDQPIQPDLFSQAVQHLYKKTPFLQISLQKRNDVLWFCQPSELQIDFEIANGKRSTNDIIYQTWKAGYRPDFTQWKIRLIPKNIETPCPMEGIRDKFPYQYDLFFTIHHGWCDGMGVLHVLSTLQKILNDMLGGRPVIDEDFSAFSLDHELIDMMNRVKENFQRDRKHFEKVKSTIPPSTRIPYMFQAFPPPKISKPFTSHIKSTLDPLVVENFRKISKEAGIKLNSSIMAVIATAIVELVKSKGIVHDTYDIIGNIQTDQRRYLKPSNVSHKCGNYSIPMSYTMRVDKNIRDNFWDFCKVMNTEVQGLLTQGYPLEQGVAKSLIDAELPVSDYTNIVRPAVHDFTITNLGDVSKFFSSDAEHVRITRLASVNFFHRYLHNSFHELSYLWNRMYYTFSYATNYFSDETAQLLNDKIISLLRELSRKP